MTAIASTEELPMEKEQRLLNLICLIAALALFAFVGYNLLAAGAVISTDGLFFTVVPTVIAVCFLAVPLQAILSRRMEKRREAKGEVVPTGGVKRVSAGTAGAPAALRTAPALKDPKGRALPPDVNRMVAEMKRGSGEVASSE